MSNQNSVFVCRLCAENNVQYKMDKRNAYRHIKEALGLIIDSPQLEFRFLKEVRVI